MKILALLASSLWVLVPTALAQSLPSFEAELSESLSAVIETAARQRKVKPEAADIQWIKIPGTTEGQRFLMGSDDGHSDTEFPWARPAHPVTVDSFEMARSPVTNQQYAACVDADACTPIAAGCSSGAEEGADKPVVCVSWSQAKAFSAWVGARLPSEAEYEYAAKSGGQPIKYTWGNEDPTCDKAVYFGCGTTGPQAVCSKPNGWTKQGLCDMAGNVWEWTQDAWHDNYQGAPANGGPWEGPGPRVFRGGSWNDEAKALRAVARDYDASGERFSDVGFRPVRSSR